MARARATKAIDDRTLQLLLELVGAVTKAACIAVKLGWHGSMLGSFCHDAYMDVVTDAERAKRENIEIPITELRCRSKHNVGGTVGPLRCCLRRDVPHPNHCGYDGNGGKWFWPNKKLQRCSSKRKTGR
jgi:hypothetical protein